MLLNWTKEDFTITEGFNSDPAGRILYETHTVKSGESRYFPDYLADHIAKHLVDRELHRKGKQVDDQDRHLYIGKCFPSEAPQVTAANPDAIGSAIKNATAPVQAEVPPPAEHKKPGPKPKPKAAFAEESFAGLKP